MFDPLLDETLCIRDEMEIEYLVAVVDLDGLSNLNEKSLQEGRWRPSGYKDWYCRIDPANPQLKQRRHVHVARQKHINTKELQRAWNDDNTRHDKATFSQNSQGINTAKRIAAKALRLNDPALLERATEPDEERFRSHSTSDVVETALVVPVLLMTCSNGVT